MFTTSMKTTMMKVLTCAAIMLAAAGSARAQSTTQGAIGGTVADATGAVIGSASVTIHNDATNAEVKLTTDGSGFYKAPLLEPGTYTVTVAATGFGGYQTKNVEVVLGQLTETNASLKTGSETSIVEVTAQAPLLNFDSPDFASNLNTRALEDIPVNNLRWSSLALTTPGVVSDSNGFGLVSIRGISPLLNNVLIDGADDNQAFYSEERGRTRDAYTTPPEAIREFTVNTGVYGAEFGRAAGGVINSVTKSGGNTLHGQAYFLDRESAWGAYNDYTTLTSPVPPFTTTPYKPSDSRRIWGFTAGGAIIKDKLFWEYTYDQHHRNFPGTAKASSPASFFALPDSSLTAGGASATCNGTGYLSGTTTGLTALTLDQQVCALAARLGLSFTAATALYSTDLGYLAADLGPVPRTGDQVVNMPKLDFQINSKNHVSFLYNRMRWDSPGGVQTQASNTYSVDGFGKDFVKLDYGVAKLTSLVSSNISNEVLYQFGRELNSNSPQANSPFTNQFLTGSGAALGEFPTVNTVSSGFGIGQQYYAYRTGNPDEHKWQIADTIYLSKGNHSIKFGADIVHNYDIINYTYEANGIFNYSSISNLFADMASEATGKPNCFTTPTSVTTNAVSSAATTGSAPNPLNLANPTGTAVGASPCYNTFVQGFGAPLYRINTVDYGAFVQDNWKVSPRLTLQLGLRYDFEHLPGNSANAYLTVPVPGSTFAPYSQLLNSPQDVNNIGPRLGFSYDLTGSGKTVVRGGYGMFYGRIPNGVLLNVLLNTGSPLGQYTASVKGNVGPTFPNLVLTGATPTAGTYFLAPNLQNPQIHQFDFIVQQQVGKGTVVSLSYLGALGRELTNFVNTNLSPTTTNTVITIKDPNQVGPLPNGMTYTVPEYTSYINKSFTNITEVISNVNSSYNGAVIEVQNRSLRTIQFDVNYTWSHSLDFNQNAQTSNAANTQYDPYGSQQLNYGNSNYNVPNRVAGYVLYNLPNTHSGGLLKYFANDWAINTAFQAQSGLPYSANLSGFASGGAISSGWNGAGGGTWVPVIGRNTYKYPRDIVQDVRLQKQISFTERYKGEARLDLYNVYNHQNVTGVNTTAYALTNTGNTATATYQDGTGTTALFGAANNSNSSGFLYTPRQVQIGFKFLF